MFRNVRPWLRFIEGVDGAGGSAGAAGGSASGASGDAAPGQGDKGDGDGDKGDGDSSGGDDDPESDPEPEPKKEDSSSEPPVDTEQADEKKDSSDSDDDALKKIEELQAAVAALQEANAKQAEEKLAAEAKDVAKSHGIPEGMADRLKGKTREELEADAKSLAQVLGTRATDPTQGQGGNGGARRSLGDVITAKIAAAGLK